MIERKAQKMKLLAERYYGKQALLQTWEQYPGVDTEYRNDLKRRIHKHRLDLTYRGADVENIV
jgi:hypothetical protein